MTRLIVALNILLAVFLIILINNYSSNFVLPNTYLSEMNISGMSYKEVEKLFEGYFQRPIKLIVSDRIYTYNFDDFGALPDYKTLKSTLFPLNSNRFPLNMLVFLKSWFAKRDILPPFIYTQDFYHFTDLSVFDFSSEKNTIAIDQVNKSLIYQDGDGTYKIEPKSFKEELAFNFGKKDGRLRPTLIKVEPRVKGIVSSYNNRLEKVFENPVLIIINTSDSLSHPFSISSNDLKRISTIDFLVDSEKVNINIDSEAFNQLVQSFIISLNDDPDKNISFLKLKEDLIYLLNARFNGESSDTLLAKIGYAPNTQGDKAEKYIEIDLSQQTMYLFESRRLLTSHKISSGLYYPTPIGEFKILNKAANAYSKIFNVWMPYWMAFYYGPDLNAYFGIHELPYFVSGEGEKIQRPREFIGAPHTGGCVALDIGAAKEVYDFSVVGMPVYVFN